jgi:hypothetical protein
MVTILTPVVFIGIIWLVWQMMHALPSARHRPWVRVAIGIATFALSFLVVGSLAPFVVGVAISVHSEVVLPQPLAILVALAAIAAAIAFPVFATVTVLRRYQALSAPAPGADVTDAPGR